MENYAEIMQKLDSEDQEEVREAVFAAGDMDYQEAVPKLAELLKSDHMGIQEAAELTLRRFGGKKAIQGIIPLLWSEEPHIRNVALDILRDIGDQDIDSILELLNNEDSDLRIFAADILGCIQSVMIVRPLCNALLQDPDPNVRYQAAISLGELGNQGASGCLKQALDDQEWIQFAVIEALKKIRDESSIKALTNALGNYSELIDSVIIETLGDMSDIKVAPFLLQIIDTSNIALRNKIVQALVNLLGSRTLTLLNRDEQEKFLSYLLTALEDEDEEVQAAAIEGLQYIGNERASEAIFDLFLKLEDGRDDERMDKIIHALRSMPISRAMKEAAYNGVEISSARAIQVLLGIEDPEVNRLLADVFWEQDRDLQRDISEALSKIGNSEVKDLFWSILQEHEDGTVIKNALIFFGHSMRCEEATDLMLSFLDHPFDDIKETALEACLALNTEKIKSKFRNMLDSSDTLHRLMGIYALGELRDPSYMEDVRSALNDAVPDVRKTALESIAKLVEGESGFIMNDFVPRLKDENKEVRLAAVNLLGELPYSKELEPYLLQALQDPDDWVIVRTLDSLVKNSYLTDVDKVIELLDNSTQLVKIKSIEALGSMGGSKALQKLLQMLNDEDPDIQHAAEEALSRISSQ
ncbi:MAG: HEAT repeat domain-containing protein [Thermodesulfobacteriota bacterium]